VASGFNYFSPLVPSRVLGELDDWFLEIKVSPKEDAANLPPTG
jgi:hypothetical protein